MISPELLSEVLPHGENTILKIEQEGHWLNIYYEIGGLTEINIHELAWKCKEWVVKQGYELESGLGWCNYYRGGVDSDSKPIDYIIADTEPEAIFKACEWILEQKATHG